MELDHEACYRAVLTRDPRFDGRIFGGVKTTGIYCRPICPARTPKSQNITFYPSAAAAEELAQETLLSVWRKAHLFNPERASSAAWIFTIARNLRIDSLRRGDASVYAADLALAADEPAQPDAVLSGAQDAELVRAAMRTLNPDQARAIEMAFFQEQTHTQISQALGVPLGTVKARIRFGMMKLRAFIERDGGGAA